MRQLKNSVSFDGISLRVFAVVLALLAFAATRANAQSFQVAPTYAVGANPNSVAVGDLNGDGYLDVVVANSGSTNISVLLNAGNGKFQPAVNYTSIFAPSSVTISDLNGDGHPDIVIGTANTAWIWINNGDATFTGPYGYSILPGQVAIGDFNGDGKLDIASSGGSILLNVGGGNFQPGPTFAVTGQSIAAGDFNGDGITDLAIGDSAGNVNILIATGGGAFTSTASYNISFAPIAAIAVTDFNSDGHLDFVATSAGGGIAEAPETDLAVYLGNGTGTFSLGSNVGDFQFAPAASGIVTGDFNHDGKQDVAVARPNTGIFVYLGNGDGTLQAASVWLPPSAGVAAGDFDKDGAIDLAGVNIAAGNVSILSGVGDGTFRAPLAYFSGYPSALPVSVATGHFNGDSLADFVSVSSVQFEGINPIQTFLNQGADKFSVAASQLSPTFTVAGSASGDLNGDAKQDLVVGANNSTLIYLGNGDGTFQPPSTLPIASTQVGLGDANGDGILDLVSISGTTLSVALGNGDATFQSPRTYSCECNAFRGGDFNGDGISDIAATDTANNTVDIFLGNGDGSFQVPTMVPVGTGLLALAAGDFNTDGKTDLAVGGSSGLYLLAGNGDGSFQTAQLIGVASRSVVAVDFNYDGHVDILSANAAASGGFTVLMGKGDGSFQAPVVYAQGITIPFLKTGDFSGDGAPDLVTGLATDAANYVVFNSGGTELKTTTSDKSLQFNEPVTFTTSVAPGVPGSGTPTGSVSFFDSTTLLGTLPVVSGAASLTVPGLSVGTHSILANYSGDAQFYAHNARPLQQRVQQAATTTAISVAQSGQSATFTFTVTVASQASGTPTGTVTLHGSLGITGAGTLDSSDVATITLTNVNPGSYRVGATYSGNANYRPSSTKSPVEINIPRNDTTTVLTSSQNPAIAGQSVTFTATVSSTIGAPPDGETVTFKQNGSVIGTATTVNGVATFSTSSLPTGKSNIRAGYAGDKSIFSSASAVLVQVVN
jgi:Bacterial Ig-like domain (group 3)/FG-GAP-like repeat